MPKSSREAGNLRPPGKRIPLSDNLLPPLSPYQAHVRDWGACTRCHLHKTRRKVCLARGRIPADVLMLGEGPGLVEDAFGQPFQGPAGHLLDHIIERAMTYEDSLDAFGNPREQLRPLWTYCLSNLLACLPVGEDGRKAAEPGQEEIEACAPRLYQLCEMIRPKLVIAVGTVARDQIDLKVKYRVELPPLHGSKPPKPIPQVWISHPAAILRSNSAVKDMAVQRAVVGIRTAVQEFVLEEGK